MVEFICGPLGFSIMKNGHMVGQIKNRAPRGWSLSIIGYTFPVTPGSVAAHYGHTESHMKIFPKLADAKKFAKTILNS